jgi:uridine kinase
MQSKTIHQYIDAKIFVDADSDVRLSRRVFKDTQENGISLK